MIPGDPGSVAVLQEGSAESMAHFRGHGKSVETSKLGGPWHVSGCCVGSMSGRAGRTAAWGLVGLAYLQDCV